MTWARAAAALLALLLQGGCALLPGATPEQGGPAPVALSPHVAGDRNPLNMQIEIDAPADLKPLLQKHLDVVRLGGASLDEVDDNEWTRLINAAPAQVRELLQTEGYFAPQVTAQRAPASAAGQPEVVRLRVEPGERARISRVTLEIQGDLERDAQAGDGRATATVAQLRRQWALPAGRDFRNAGWNDAKSATLGRLRAAGYALAIWSGTGAEVDVARNEVRLFLVADSGPLFRYGGLVIEGLNVQDAQTVRNLADTQRGTPVTEALLLDYQDRLQKSGLFESITVMLDTDPARADEARVIVRVTEAPQQVYTFGVGFSANTGGRVSVEHVYRRVFGHAATAYNKVEWGEKRQAWDGEISTHAGERMYRNLLGGAVENLISDSDTVLSQRIRLGRTRDTKRIERLFFGEVERSKREAAGTTVQSVAVSINYHGVWRDLDNVLLPTRGTTLAAQVGAGQSRGTDAQPGPFVRGYARLTAYLPVQSFYTQARLEVGQTYAPREGTVLPDSQLFRAGGDDSVRAYEYRSLGPLVNGVVGSGDSLLTTSVEIARPVSASLPSLWGAVFVDAGNAANTFKDFKFKVGTGVGVRWRSPVGPLRLDLAWSPETREYRFHFNVGIAF